MTTTMREIAKKAGVSHTTVWRVLNGISSVKEETRKKVMEIAQKVGYDHPPMRGGIALRRVKNIRLLVFEFERLTRPLFIEVIRGIERVTRKNGYHLQFSSVEEEFFFFHTKFGPLKETLPISGFILFGVDLTSEEIQTLKNRGLPFVLLNSKTQEPGVPYVFPDYRGGTYLALKHLASLGHKRIGFITGPMELQLDKEKMEGFWQAVKDFNLEKDERLIRKGDYLMDKAYRKTIELLNLKPPPTAIFAADDTMAVGVVEAAKEKGISVPEDLSVMGFNNMEIASLISPSLTTVRVPMLRMGELAAEILLEKIEKKEEGRKVILPTQIVVRNSTGPVKR